MIAIIDYGLGNLRCAQKAFEFLGFDAVISGDYDEISKAEKLILPGVGAFRDAIGRLRETRLDRCVIEAVEKEKYVLGICLGMQLLFESSLEGAEYEGLGLLKGTIRRFKTETLKVPQIGWNQVETLKESPILSGLNGADFYFVHSYCAEAGQSHSIGESEYGERFSSVVGEGTLFGTQFHPEKSGEAGLQLLRQFARL